MSNTAQNQTTTDVPTRYMLWIDGVGAWLVCTDDRVVVGSPSDSTCEPDVPILADLSRKHASILRRGDGYLLEAHSAAAVQGREVEERINLNDDYEIQLRGGVRLRFRLPTVLSATAVLDFVSRHRPQHSVDGVVLMDGACLIGPGSENHVVCTNWPDSVVLYRRDDRFFCKSRHGLTIDGRFSNEEQALNPGDVVTGRDLRFRLEAIEN